MNKINLLLCLMAALLAIGCSKKKKCYKCISATYIAASQADYDNGYSPDTKEGCVGQEYMKGSSSTIHHKTSDEVQEEVRTWESEGYKCEWK